MPHLSLANARRGAENILHHDCPGLRLKVQLGRCVILKHRQVLSAATTWEQALEQLLQAEVVRFVTRHNLSIPDTEEFASVAELYLSSPNDLITKYPQKPEPTYETTNL